MPGLFFMFLSPKMLSTGHLSLIYIYELSGNCQNRTSTFEIPIAVYCAQDRTIKKK